MKRKEWERFDEEHRAIFQRRIAECMEKADETPIELAAAIGVSMSMVYNHLSGNCLPRATTACRIARHYAVSLEWLFGMEDDHAGL